MQMSTAQQAIDAIIPAPLMPALRDVTRRISYRRDIVPMLRPTEGIHRLRNDAAISASARVCTPTAATVWGRYRNLSL